MPIIGLNDVLFPVSSAASAVPKLISSYSNISGSFTSFDIDSPPNRYRYNSEHSADRIRDNGDDLRHLESLSSSTSLPHIRLLDLRLHRLSLSVASISVPDERRRSTMPTTPLDFLVPESTSAAVVDGLNSTSLSRAEADVAEWPRSVAADIVLGVLLATFVVFAIAGNILVIVAILTDRTLRQTGNYFLVSLAVADTLVGVAVMTFAAANDVLGRWPFGPIVCDLWLSADVMCSTASILNLCAVSLDRYVHIRSPLHYNRLVTHRRVLAAIGLVWILSALISFLPIQLGWHRPSQPQQSNQLPVEMMLTTEFSPHVSGGLPYVFGAADETPYSSAADVSMAASSNDDITGASITQDTGVLIELLMLNFTTVPSDVVDFADASDSTSASGTTTTENVNAMSYFYSSSPTLSSISEAPQCLLDLSAQYAVVSSMVSFFIPCIAMMFFYVNLHRYARRHAENIKKSNRFSAPVPSFSSTAPHTVNGIGGSTSCVGDGGNGSPPLILSPSPKPNNRRFRARGNSSASGSGGALAAAYRSATEHKAAITLGVIMGVFLFCWVPFFTINVVAAFCTSECIPQIVFSVFTWLGYLNSTMNPIIYSVFNRQFRDAFKRVLKIRHRNNVAGGNRRADFGLSSDGPNCCYRCWCCLNFLCCRQRWINRNASSGFQAVGNERNSGISSWSWLSRSSSISRRRRCDDGSVVAPSLPRSHSDNGTTTSTFMNSSSTSVRGDVISSPGGAGSSGAVYTSLQTTMTTTTDL